MTEFDGFIVTMQDAREFTEFGMDGCVEGWRLFIENNGYGWRDVVLNGMTIKQLKDTDDAMAISLANYIILRETRTHE